jgi:hypothetical protein
MNFYIHFIKPCLMNACRTMTLSGAAHADRSFVQLSSKPVSVIFFDLTAFDKERFPSRAFSGHPPTGWQPEKVVGFMNKQNQILNTDYGTLGIIGVPATVATTVGR